MLHLNCKYRGRILKILKETRLIKEKRKDLENKYAPLKRELAPLDEVKILNNMRAELRHELATIAYKQMKLFKAIQGDEVDELLTYHLNKAQLTSLPVKRLSKGNYMFGTR